MRRDRDFYYEYTAACGLVREYIRKIEHGRCVAKFVIDCIDFILRLGHYYFLIIVISL